MTNTKKEQMYMNVNTGSVDTKDGWDYTDMDGKTRNSVDEGEVGVEEVYIIRDREAGNWIDDTFMTRKDAEEQIKVYEKEDRTEGNYTDNFYEIY